jgi:hypothetical protein
MGAVGLVERGGEETSSALIAEGEQCEFRAGVARDGQVEVGEVPEALVAVAGGNGEPTPTRGQRPCQRPPNGQGFAVRVVDRVTTPRAQVRIFWVVLFPQPRPRGARQICLIGTDHVAVQPISALMFEPQEPLRVCHVFRMPDTSRRYGPDRCWPPTAHASSSAAERAIRSVTAADSGVARSRSMTVRRGVLALGRCWLAVLRAEACWVVRYPMCRWWRRHWLPCVDADVALIRRLVVTESGSRSEDGMEPALVPA